MMHNQEPCTNGPLIDQAYLKQTDVRVPTCSMISKWAKMHIRGFQLWLCGLATLYIANLLKYSGKAAKNLSSEAG